MTLNEALKCADAASINRFPRASEDAAIVLAAEVRRLRTENAALRLYAPARRAQPTIKTTPIAPTRWPAWGIPGVLIETDEEFAARAGQRIEEVGV